MFLSFQTFQSNYFLFFRLISIEYWFRCMDLDGDGIISLYELQYFYEDQVQKMMELGMETLSFEDCLCQVRLPFYTNVY